MTARSAALSLPIALGITLFAPVLLPAEINPGITMVVAAVAGAVLLVLALVVRRRTSTAEALLALGAAVALAAWLTVRSLAALNPAVSFMGNVSQHAGSALWWIVAAWMGGAVLLADRRALRELLGVGAVSGAVFGAWGTLEALAGEVRGWGSAAGPFENSSSLGTYLAVAALAALAWGLSSRAVTVRGAAALCGSLSIAGILAADSRAGLVGLAAGLAVAAIARFAPVGRAARWALAGGLPVAALAVSAALVAAATSALGTGALAAVRALGTERDVIWRSAAAQLAQAPLGGVGPEQFSAWIAWSLAEGEVSVIGTYDPHNALAGLALGGGVVAVLLWLTFAAGALVAMLGVLHRAGRPVALAAIVGLPCALMGAALFTWLTPAAAVLAAVVTGALLAADAEREATSRTRDRAGQAAVIIVALLVALACGVVAVLGMPMLTAEHAFVTGKDTLDAAGFAALHERWPDPASAALAIDAALTREGNLAIAEQIAGTTQGQAAWHVDLALREIYLAQVPLRDDPSQWPAFEEAIERGATADPASGLWYTLAAAQADAMGLSDEAAAYALLALALDQGPRERALLEELAAGR